ncbi:MAG: AAA family ATPase [Elusimicrobiota bacterium]|jgi:hypothetical protein|nr:AAA family ATPase [Elusimicrobiota bacterium]
MNDLNLILVGIIVFLVIIIFILTIKKRSIIKLNKKKQNYKETNTDISFVQIKSAKDILNDNNILAKQAHPEGYLRREIDIGESIFPEALSKHLKTPYIRPLANCEICLPADFIETSEFKNLFKTIEETNRNVFISGKAGTGKSTFLTYLRKKTKKRMIFLATTGIAALNISGQTVHSFFRFAAIDFLMPDDIKQFPKEEIINSIDAIVIDEASMLRVDIFSAIDYSLKKVRKSTELFGGLQIILIGDLCQLPPVIKNVLEMPLIEKFGGMYFFNFFRSPDLFAQHFLILSLTEIFRHKDKDFIDLLSRMRYGCLTKQDYQMINEKTIGQVDDVTIITTTNIASDRENNLKLSQLNAKLKTYEASIHDYRQTKFNKSEDLFKDTRVDRVLKFKVGAKVIVLANDLTERRRYANGTIGVIVEMGEDEIIVLANGYKFPVKRKKWNKVEYAYNRDTKRLEERAIATFEQFPLKLAWSITIHKSQGLTFDDINIDLAGGAFAFGQVYVAFSRCRSFSGLHLLRPLTSEDIKIERHIVEFEMKYVNKG